MLIKVNPIFKYQNIPIKYGETKNQDFRIMSQFQIIKTLSNMNIFAQKMKYLLLMGSLMKTKSLKD